jgi:hypothetical protein
MRDRFAVIEPKKELFEGHRWNSSGSRTAPGTSSPPTLAAPTRSRWSGDPAHIDEFAREKRRAHELRGRDRRRAACPSADVFVEALAGAQSTSAGQVSRLLRLLDRCEGELEAALKDALARGAIGAASVSNVLDQRPRPVTRAEARRGPPRQCLRARSPRHPTRTQHLRRARQGHGEAATRDLDKRSIG